MLHTACYTKLKSASDPFMNVIENYSLKLHNTLALDQRARFFVTVNNEHELLAACQFASEKKISLLMLGEGSNVILSQDYPGLVAKNNIKGISVISGQGNSAIVEVGAGENWHGLVCHALENYWFGLENLALIPGTVGAAPVQNIGAYGVELGEFILNVRVWDRQEKAWRVLSNSDCRFSYRDSVFKQQQNRYLITSVQLQLRRKANVNIMYQALRDYLSQLHHTLEKITPHQVFAAVIAIRQSRLPDPVVIPNVGSFFKNPIIPLQQYEQLIKKFPALVSYPAGTLHRKLAAAWLIDQAGWKGKREGNVAVHDQQALVLVNSGNASGAELLTFANKICADIKRRYGVALEIEPVVI